MERRELLRNIGAVGTGLALFGMNTVSATGLDEHQALNLDLKAILQSDQTESILGALGHPAPEQVAADRTDENSPITIRRTDIKTEVTSIDHGPKLAVTTIPTNLGDITTVSVDGELASVANFEFSDEITSHQKQRLDVGPSLSWPDGTSAILIGTATDAYFMRETTTAENQRLADATGVDIGQATAVVGDDWSGYSVHPEVDGRAALDQNGFKLNTEFEIMGRIDPITDPSSDPITPNDCDLKLVECLTVMIPLPNPCIACGIACSGGQTILAIGQVACIVCLLATCGAVVGLYSACAGVQDCV